MGPVVEAMAREYASRPRVLQMDADDSPATMTRFGVRGLPTMLAFREGELVERIVGAMTAAALRERLARLVGP
jgi:thioredoxin 1